MTKPLLERIRDAEAQAIALAEEAGFAKRNKTEVSPELNLAINNALLRMCNLTHRLLNKKAKTIQPDDDAND